MIFRLSLFGGICHVGSLEGIYIYICMVCQLTFIFKPVKTWREGFWSIEVEVSRGLMVTTFLPKVIFNPEPVGTFSDYGHEDWLKYGQILILLARSTSWLLVSLGPGGLESEPCDDSDIVSVQKTVLRTCELQKLFWNHLEPTLRLLCIFKELQKKTHEPSPQESEYWGTPAKTSQKKSASPQKRSAQLMFLPE